MPTLFYYLGLRFYFFSNDHEPVHVHVSKGNAEARFRIDPVAIIENHGLKPKDIIIAELAIEENKEVIIQRWNKFSKNKDMEAKKVWFGKDKIYLETADGKTASLGLKAFPRLYNATEEQKLNFTFSPFGIHWTELDEDLSFDGFFDQQVEEPGNEVAKMLNLFPEINIHQLAKRIGINQSLLAKYKCGIKKPSEERIQQIREALHSLGRDLCNI